MTTLRYMNLAAVKERERIQNEKNRQAYWKRIKEQREKARAITNAKNAV
jgi:hypothetical protein